MGNLEQLTSCRMHTNSWWNHLWSWSHRPLVSGLSGWASRTFLWEKWGGRYQDVCSHCILSTNSAPQTGCSGCDRHRCDHDVLVLHHTNGWAPGNEGEDDGYLPTYSCHHRSSGGEVWCCSFRSYIPSPQHLHTYRMWHSELSVQKRKKIGLHNCY